MRVCMEAVRAKYEREGVYLAWLEAQNYRFFQEQTCLVLVHVEVNAYLGHNVFQVTVIEFDKVVPVFSPFLEECGVGGPRAKVDEVDGFDCFLHQKCS